MAQQTQTPPLGNATPRPDMTYDVRGGRDRDRGYGWLVFAGAMLLAAAMINTIYGISALVNDDYFAADELLFGDLSLWGVIYLCLAAVQVVTGLLIFARSRVGAAVGIGIALLHATAALLSIGAYPLWSVTMLVIDGLIIYGLSAYGFAEE